MRIKKMIKMLNQAIEKNPHLYSYDELEYMKKQLHMIENNVLKIQHKDYKGFGEKK